MKEYAVAECECGQELRAEDRDLLAEMVLDHYRQQHPDRYLPSGEQIRSHLSKSAPYRARAIFLLLPRS